MSKLDRMITVVDGALRTLSGASVAARPYPASQLDSNQLLGEAQRRLSGALMRVNHVGEVCAQALYQAQAIATDNAALRDQHERAAREETDHLAWTQQRLRELGAHTSWLNPLWYSGAFMVGLLAGRKSNALSLGFVVETERQVEQHLQGHLVRLPEDDHASLAIVRQMKHDEAQHAAQAVQAGAEPLPPPVRWAMRVAAGVMVRTAHYL